MSTKITTPELFNLSSNNTAATQLPVFTTSTRPTPTTSTITVDYLVVAGGGGTRGDSPGGGGAGGLRTSYGTTSGGGNNAENALTLSTSTAYTVTVGNGTDGSISNTGEDSVFSSITSNGGGRGGGSPTASNYPGFSGGSGGGGAGGQYGAAGGSGTTNQGFAGGASQNGGLPYAGGGGGGAGGLGTAGAATATGGVGGIGVAVNILPAAQAAAENIGEVSGSDVYYAGGGGGTIVNSSPIRTGGLGGGGDGISMPPNSTNNGAPNTGGGGGGYNATGGSGIVILRYPTSSSQPLKTTGSLVYKESTDGSDTIIQFTEGSGNVSFASAGITVGEMIFNSTTGKVEYWDGFQWNKIKDEAVAPPLEPNQILWLDANNTSSWTGSGTTWYDVSGNGYNATITTTVPGTGTVNGATYLNIPDSDRNDYFKIPYSVHSGALNMTSGNVITWLYWMRLPTIPTSVNGLNVLLKASPAGLTTNQVYLRYYDPSAEGFNPFVYDSGGTADVNPGYIAPVNNNDWFMFVASYNFPTNNFQFHRYQPNTTTYNNTALGNVSPQWSGNSDIYLISEPASIYGGYGELGEIRAYDTIFTTTEITAKYNAQKGKYGIT